MNLTRRDFFRSAAMGAAVLAAPRAIAQPATPPICVFSKHLQFLDYKELAKTVKDLGLDGVDLTVRSGGHVLPENVATDLPRAADAIRAEGLDVSMITTRLHRGVEPEAEPILQAAAKENIRFARINGHHYSGRAHPMEELERFTRDLRRLSELLEEHGVTAGYHNHSGYNNVGAPLWDLYRMFEAVDSPNLGSNFDVGHAVIEGAYGAWEINARLIAPHVKMMAAKDFVWNDDGRPEWVPLGHGNVPLVDCLKIMREARFNGPISLHFEYDPGSRDDLLEHIHEAGKTLRKTLKEAGYTSA